ncbi:hypothetical protein [Azohydromonas caseinilytica]|uniref:HNH endonuclease n=1 Tax=Azohydromonas caseinilytica TaxID=2728836 RepID=A0A848F4B0_9BURK|nr:hypothetical protein [Azohydromonas caseinilytica]NML13426.1 hypothetical protein [Azohydromonas caseinilytica]
MTSSRDNFTKEVARALQERAGNHCSNPQCRCLTSGPNEFPTKSSRIGIAAHITAAAPGGPRYDSSITAEERSSIKNGIWLCQSCSRLIDTDPSHYPIELLSQWRTNAEQWAREHIESGTRFSVLNNSTDTDPSKNREAKEPIYIEYSIDENSIKRLPKKEVYKYALIFYASFPPPILVILAHYYNILSSLGTGTGMALTIAATITIASAVLTNTHRKIATTTFRSNTASFIDGYWFEQEPDGNYIRYIKQRSAFTQNAQEPYSYASPPFESKQITRLSECAT